VFGCYEIPGYGGASTAAYRFFELVQRQGYEASFINLVSQEDDLRFNRLFGRNYGNPKALKNVSNCLLDQPLFSQQDNLSRLLMTLESDIMVGFDYIASFLMKQAAPQTYLIFYTMGCEQLKAYVDQNHISDLQAFSQFAARSGQKLQVRHRFEKEAAENADLIITHSDVIKSLYVRFFPECISKIHDKVIWVADWIYQEALEYRHFKKPFAARSVDLLFIASSWSRIEKNFSMIKNLVPHLKDLRIHLVGETDIKIHGVTHHGLVTDRSTLFSILGDARTVASLSLYDAAPQILFEGSALGCNLVSSKNSGNWMICNENLLVNPLTEDRALAAIRKSLRAEALDNIEYFLGKDSYNSFVDVLSEF
jgi:glycosyltransferase involved in cell wall biosynthesis